MDPIWLFEAFLMAFWWVVTMVWQFNGTCCYLKLLGPPERSPRLRGDLHELRNNPTVAQHQIILRHSYRLSMINHASYMILYNATCIHDNTWYIMIIHDISWYIMIIHDISWYIMIYHDESWLIRYGIHLLWSVFGFPPIFGPLKLASHQGSRGTCRVTSCTFPVGGKPCAPMFSGTIRNSSKRVKNHSKLVTYGELWWHGDAVH